MIPYKEAGEEIKRQGEKPFKLAKTLGSAVIGGLSINRVIPFLSNLIPKDLAIKGLTKLDNRFGKFFQKAMSNGKTFEEARDFIKEQIIPSSESIGKEKTLTEKGVLPNVKSELNRREGLQKFNQKLKKSNIREDLMQQYNQQYGQEQPQQGNPRDAELLAKLEQILNM